MSIYNGKRGKKPNGYDDSVTKEFLKFMDELILAPDTVIKKDHMKTAVAIIKRYRNKGLNDTSETMIEGQRNEIATLTEDNKRLREALECLIIGACAVAVPHPKERSVLQEAVEMAQEALRGGEVKGK